MSSKDFDYGDRLTELRRHPTAWLRAHRADLVRRRREFHVEELAVTRVLDERDAMDPMPDATVSTRTTRAELEVSRRLESLPEVAAAAHAGELSWDQLQPLVEVATPESDAEWSERGPRYAPIDLERLARARRGVSAEDAAARRDAREFRLFWRPRTGMLGVRGELPDIDGAIVKGVFERMTEAMRPPKGERWDTLAHRNADALVELCKNYADVEPTGRAKPLVIVQVPLGGPAEVDGVPIAETTLDGLIDGARIDQQVIDERGGLCTDSNLDQDSIPADVRRFVLARDQHCRVPGCEATNGLEIHHPDPRCRGGNHDPAKLAAVCPHHHAFLVPNGPYWLIGDPNQPDGLRLVHRDELLQNARAGP